MDNRIGEFINSLKENLPDLSEDEKTDVILYYEEYLQDANDSGKDMDEVFRELGKPVDIASVIQAEITFEKASKKPGIKSFNKVIKNIFLGVSGPFGYAIRSLYLFVMYSLIIVFTGASLASLLCSVSGFAVLLYEALKIPSAFAQERFGTLGMALLVMGLFAIITYAFFRISRFLIAGATDTIRKMVRRKVHHETYGSSQEENKKQSYGKLIPLIFSIAIIAGLVICIASGLPFKLFYIFNSMRPDNIKLSVNEFSAGQAKDINITTEHSCIKIVKDNKNPDKIVITYQQPDWLDYHADSNQGIIAFKELSNGRLPLFYLVSLHESRTDVTVYLPENIDLNEINIESRGGFVYIDDVVENINVKTHTGSIYLDNSRTDEPYNIKARTESGKIEADWIPEKDKANSEISYNHQEATKTIELISSRGSISIK